MVSFARWQEQHETVFGQQDGDLVLTTSLRDKLGLLTANGTSQEFAYFREERP